MPTRISEGSLLRPAGNRDGHPGEPRTIPEPHWASDGTTSTSFFSLPRTKVRTMGWPIGQPERIRCMSSTLATGCRPWPRSGRPSASPSHGAARHRRSGRSRLRRPRSDDGSGRAGGRAVLWIADDPEVGPADPAGASGSRETTQRAVLDGTAKPIPWAWAMMAVLMPTTLPGRRGAARPSSRG